VSIIPDPIDLSSPVDASHLLLRVEATSLLRLAREQRAAFPSGISIRRFPICPHFTSLGSAGQEKSSVVAGKVQEAGYRMRIRPIIRFNGWKVEYDDTIKRIFNHISPESIMVETLRFEEGFY
jgi:hypothetical protein